MSQAYLIYAAPANDANLFHWGKFWAPDPFLAIKTEGHNIAVVTMLEYARCKSTSCFDTVLLWSDLVQASHCHADASGFEKVIQCLQEQYNISSFVIPDNFPAALYEQIRRYNVQFDPHYFQTQRKIKNQQETEHVQAACHLTAQSILHAKAILQESQIGAHEQLYYQGQVLTSERLRSEIECFCLQANGHCEGTIVSCGQEAANPHCEGNGPLYANEFIVIDVFPRLNQYYGDMTRTFLKGQASQEQRQMLACVQQCQQEIIKRIKPGVDARTCMQFAQTFFEQNGYGLKKTERGYEGFIHSVGHGVGIDLHEYPSIANSSIQLEPNMVFTVEPGLYFEKLGGVRIEDVVQVTDDGCKLLSHCPYDWIL